MDTRTDPGQYYPGGRVMVRPDVAPPQAKVNWSDIEGKPDFSDVATLEAEDSLGNVKTNVNKIVDKMKTAVIVLMCGLSTALSALAATTLNDLPGTAEVYTAAETDAAIIRLAPAPGNYLAVSNAAMNAATPSITNGLATVARSGSYEDLANKPTIPAPVTIDVTLSTQGAAADAKATGDALAAKYTKPSSGIPKTHLAADVRTSLGKADNAVSNAVAEVTAVTGEWQWPATFTYNGDVYHYAPSFKEMTDTSLHYYYPGSEPSFIEEMPGWMVDVLGYEYAEGNWEPTITDALYDTTSGADATALNLSNTGLGISLTLTYAARNKYGLARLVDIGNAATPGIVTNIVRDLSLGGIWDSQLGVWWTPRMRNGSLTYEATTNVNLNAGN